ncbi:MAG: hypothetical protein MUF18_21795 [Fimbriiglobus sp.]|jgi:hypothetical protein|nr:hypothetical protein [Fimbriiglobus sp.]
MRGEFFTRFMFTLTAVLFAVAVLAIPTATLRADIRPPSPVPTLLCDLIDPDCPTCNQLDCTLNVTPLFARCDKFNPQDPLSYCFCTCLKVGINPRFCKCVNPE